MTVKTLPLKPNGHELAHNDGNEVTVFLDALAHGLGPWVSGAMSYCATCGEAPEYRVTEEAVHVVTPCAYPNGITTVITLAVPSGKIIINDDLRDVYAARGDGFASYNTSRGQAQVIEAMAAIGCAYGPVGNSCPGLYQLLGEGRYVIASPAYDDDDEPIGDLATAKDLASICTNLWAYSIADYEDWKAKGGDPEMLKFADTVDVPPGVYQFTHHTGENGFDHYAAGEVIFAHIERIS